MRRTLALVLSVIVLAVTAGAWHVLMRIDPAARAQLELLRAPTAFDGTRDAFAPLWLIGYDVPADVLEAVAAEDVARFVAWRAAGRVGALGSVASERFPILDVPDLDDPALCGHAVETCLARVRADPDATRAALARHAVLLAHGRALAAYGSLRDPFPPVEDAPLPLSTVNPHGLVLAAAALDYATGDRAGALATLCADARAWRSIRAHTDSLLAESVATRRLGDAATLYAQLRTDACADAFAPLAPAELGFCAPLKREFAILERALADLEAPLGAGARPRWLARLTLDRERSAAHFAPRYAWWCGEGPLHALAAGRAPGESALPSPQGSGAACFANLEGCSLAGSARARSAHPLAHLATLLELDARLRARDAPH